MKAAGAYSPHFLCKFFALKDNSLDRSTHKLTWLIVLACFITALLGYILKLSHEFELSQPTTDRPILMVLGLFATAFVAYLFSIHLAKTSTTQPS